MNFKEYLAENNISVRRASEELGVSRQHIYDIEKGQTYPSRKLARKIEDWSGGIIKKEGLLFGERAAC